MLASSPIPKQTVGKTFFVALCILGIGALIQLGAVGWAFVSRFHSATPDETGAAMRNLQTPTEETEKLKMTESFVPPESVQVTSLPKPTPVAPVSQRKPLPPAQGRQNELAEQAQALRDRGDMSTALTRLREAQALSPDNSYIISEMAVTYEKMGMKDKAMEQWRRIYDMGESAGIYYSAADAKLKNGEAQPKPGADGSRKDAEGFQPGSTLALIDISKVDSPDEPDRKFVLKVPLKTRAGSKIVVHDVAVQVLFYDQVDDGSIVQTNANITNRWSTLPSAWNDTDIQILEVEYSAAALNAKARQPENRKYFGYIVRVYYKGDLQDIRAEPVKLLKQYPPPLTLSTEETK